MPLPPKPFLCVELLFFFSAGRGGWELVGTEFPVQTVIGYRIECLILGFIFLMNVQICVSLPSQTLALVRRVLVGCQAGRGVRPSALEEITKPEST